MIINTIISEDYENAGNLYKLEVSTESAEEFEQAWLLMLQLKSDLDFKRRLQIYGG